MTAEPNQDETLLRWPRQASGGDYTEPAPSGFFYAWKFRWPLAVMAMCTALGMNACGLSQAEAMPTPPKPIPQGVCPAGKVGEWVETGVVECFKELKS